MTPRLLWSVSVRVTRIEPIGLWIVGQLKLLQIRLSNYVQCLSIA